MFRPGASCVLILGVAALAALAGAACSGTVGRGTPVPGRTPEPAARTTTATATASLTSPSATATALAPTPARSPSPATASPVTPTRAPSPSPTAPVVTLTPRLVLPTATPTAVVGNPVATVSTELTLDIFGIGEETIVKGASIIVAGRTRADAVLSINGVIIPLNADGRFEVTVALNMGPNLIEVVASDPSGNQKSRVLAVIALPEA
jgi:hypothetical protein